MDQRQLLGQIHTLDETGMRRIAGAIRVATGTAAGEVAWWRATIAVEREIRHAHALVAAGLVAHRAATAVTDRAGELGLPLPDPDVTTVARAAAEAARALVAGGAVADDVLTMFGPCWPGGNDWRWTAA